MVKLQVGNKKGCGIKTQQKKFQIDNISYGTFTYSWADLIYWPYFAISWHEIPAWILFSLDFVHPANLEQYATNNMYALLHI